MMCIRKQKPIIKDPKTLTKRVPKLIEWGKILFIKLIESILKTAPIKPPRPTTKMVFSKA